MSRDPAEVIDAILTHVPADRMELRTALETIKNDSFYLPPEGKREAWVMLARKLSASLAQPPREPWEIMVCDIVEGRAEPKGEFIRVVTLSDIETALQAVLHTLVGKNLLTIPPQLAVELPNISRCLTELRGRMLREQADTDPPPASPA